MSFCLFTVVIRLLTLVIYLFMIVSHSRAKSDSVTVGGAIDPAKESLESVLNALEDGK